MCPLFSLAPVFVMMPFRHQDGKNSAASFSVMLGSSDQIHCSSILRSVQDLSFGSGILKGVIRDKEENIMHTLVFGAHGTWMDFSSVLDSVPSLTFGAAAQDCHVSGQGWWLSRG